MVAAMVVDRVRIATCKVTVVIGRTVTMRIWPQFLIYTRSKGLEILYLMPRNQVPGNLCVSCDSNICVPF